MYNRKNKLIHFFLLAIIPISLFSCAKNSSENTDDPSKDSSMSMNIDGRAWSSTINTLFTELHQSTQFGEYYLVLISGQRSDVKDSENDVSGINLYISIPKSKLNSPKGTYMIMKESEAKVGQGLAMYTKSTDEGSIGYASYNPANPKETVGVVEITDFKVGQQTMAGQQTGIEGYKKLSGTFKLDVYPIKENPGPKLKITEGKFNLNSGLGFDFN